MMNNENIKNKKVLLVAPLQDGQSGLYIHNALIKLKRKVAYFDLRVIGEKYGVDVMNKRLIEAVDQLTPDIVIIIKGLGIKPETVKEIKKRQPKMHVAGWIFDVTLGGVMVSDSEPYITLIKEFDTFYTIDNDAVPELKKLGVNALWVPEGCDIKMHSEQVINSVQERKYGADVVFLGAVGSIHPNREKFLKRLYDEGINFKIYGDVYYPEGKDPEWIQNTHTGYSAVNDMHSIVVQSSKIVIGLDGWPHRSKSWSARLYRTMCAGGFYLTTHTKDIETCFEIGKHLDTFKDEDEMVEKVLYWLQNDEKREQVAETGCKLVQDKYKFKDAVEVIVNNG